MGKKLAMQRFFEGTVFSITDPVVDEKTYLRKFSWYVPQNFMILTQQSLLNQHIVSESQTDTSIGITSQICFSKTYNRESQFVFS